MQGLIPPETVISGIPCVEKSSSEEKRKMQTARKIVRMDYKELQGITSALKQ